MCPRKTKTWCHEFSGKNVSQKTRVEIHRVLQTKKRIIGKTPAAEKLIPKLMPKLMSKLIPKSEKLIPKPMHKLMHKLMHELMHRTHATYHAGTHAQIHDMYSSTIWRTDYEAVNHNRLHSFGC